MPNADRPAPTARSGRSPRGGERDVRDGRQERGPRRDAPPSRDDAGREPRRGSGQRRSVPRGGTPRGFRPGEGARPTGGGQEKARRRPTEAAAKPVSLAAPGNELLYGRNAVAEALRGPREVRRLYLAEGMREDDRLRAMIGVAGERGASIDHVPRLLLDDLFAGSNHQGVALEAKPYPYAALEDILPDPGTVLVLDHLQDPQNFGTLLRAADAAGVAGVVIAHDRAVAVTPSVVNASSGAVEHLKVAQVTNLVRAIESLKASGRWAIGLDGGDDVADLYATDLPTPAALVVGAEGSGMGVAVRKACDVLVRLPMRGHVASLNAATAGAIALYELLRREPAVSPSGEEGR